MTRNPYLLLGVDYGAPGGVARKAFAKAARRVRRATDSDVTVEELTAALHEVEAAEGDPFDEVERYRVPADPSVFVPAGSGVLDPPAVPLARTTAPRDPADLLGPAADEIAQVLDAVVAGRATFDHGYVFLPEGPAS